MKKTQKPKLSPGLKEFLIKSLVFIAIFILIQVLTMNLAAKTFFPKELKPLAFDDLAEATFFVLILFLAFNKEKIMKIKSYTVTKTQRIIPLILILASFPIYFYYKNFVINNLDMAVQNKFLFISIEYLILVLILFLLALAVYGARFLKDFYKENKIGLISSAFAIALIYLTIRKFQESWFFLSSSVGHSVNYMLSFFGDSSFYFSGNIPIIRVDSFVVGIAKTCSGIDSIFLFTALFLGVLAWDYKILNKKKIAILFIPGLLGAFALNIVRIFALILIGAKISESFALNVFHTNASAILFLVYFAIFWKIFYKWAKV